MKAKIEKTEVGDEDLAGLLKIVVDGGGGGPSAKVSGSILNIINSVIRGH